MRAHEGQKKRNEALKKSRILNRRISTLRSLMLRRSKLKTDKRQQQQQRARKMHIRSRSSSFGVVMVCACAWASAFGFFCLALFISLASAQRVSRQTFSLVDHSQVNFNRSACSACVWSNVQCTMHIECNEFELRSPTLDCISGLVLLFVTTKICVILCYCWRFFVRSCSQEFRSCFFGAIFTCFTFDSFTNWLLDTALIPHNIQHSTYSWCVHRARIMVYAREYHHFFRFGDFNEVTAWFFKRMKEKRIGN